MGYMETELPVVPDCPRQAAAVDLLGVALADVGLPAAFTVVTVDDTTRRGFIGSPTFQADGTDLFPQTGQPAGLRCRLYRTGRTSSGLPELPALRQALKSAADQARTAPTT